jgi:hypothetical protein
VHIQICAFRSQALNRRKTLFRSNKCSPLLGLDCENAGGAHLVVRLDELQSMRTQDLKGTRAEDAAAASGASQIYWLGRSVQNDLPAHSEGPLVGAKRPLAMLMMPARLPETDVMGH